MPTPPLTDEQCREVWQAYVAADYKAKGAAEILGMAASTFDNRLKRAKERGVHLSEGAQRVVQRAGLSGIEAKGGWIHDYDDEGKKIGTTRWTAPEIGSQELAASLVDNLASIVPGKFDVPPVRQSSGGLLIIDLADVHIGKLCVAAETGYSYSRDVAVHRMIDGTQRLLRKSQGHGIARVLVVLGNDILHIDTPKRQTTSGTPQDTDGSLHQMYLDAQAAYIRVVELCAAEYPVDLVYCPSNHDWMMGWALANSIGIWFKHHPNVTATDYNLSQAHRKYYRYEGNLIGLTHGDGAKEVDLYPLMMTEARSHVSDCPHRYWYVHHLHHKIRKMQGVRPHDREKDHIGLTTIKSGLGAQEGDNVQIEYVRSPSPPDSWHDRNGYVNRQAVECFIHDPHDGQNARFSEWF